MRSTDVIGNLVGNNHSSKPSKMCYIIYLRKEYGRDAVQVGPAGSKAGH